MISFSTTVSEDHLFADDYIRLCRELNATGRLPRQFADRDRVLRVHVHGDGAEQYEIGMGPANWHTSYTPGLNHFSSASEIIWLPTGEQCERLIAQITGEDIAKVTQRIRAEVLTPADHERAALYELASVLPPVGHPVAPALERENQVIAWAILHEGMRRHEARSFFPARMAFRSIDWEGTGRVGELARMHLAILETPVGTHQYQAGIAGYKRSARTGGMPGLEATFSTLFAAEYGAAKVGAQRLDGASPGAVNPAPAAPEGLSPALGHLYAGRLAWALGDDEGARLEWAMASSAGRTSAHHRLAEALIGHLHRARGGWDRGQVGAA